MALWVLLSLVAEPPGEHSSPFLRVPVSIGAPVSPHAVIGDGAAAESLSRSVGPSQVRMLGRASVLLFAVTICTTVIALSHVWERTGKWPWEPKDTP